MAERPVALNVAVVLDGRHRYVLAELAGVSATTFSGVLSGRIQPSASLRQRIADVLGQPVKTLFPAELADSTK